MERAPPILFHGTSKEGYDKLISEKNNLQLVDLYSYDGIENAKNNAITESFRRCGEFDPVLLIIDSTQLRPIFYKGKIGSEKVNHWESRLNPESFFKVNVFTNSRYEDQVRNSIISIVRDVKRKGYYPFAKRA